MKKKLVISIVSIMSFILLLSGILILNNKEVKNSSVDKDLKSENQEDTTWQDDFIYIRDKQHNYIVLNKYLGSDTNVVIPSKAIIDGVEYTTMPLGARNDKFFDNSLDSLTIEDGVIFPPHIMELFDVNVKKLIIGNVDVSLLDSLTHGVFGYNTVLPGSELIDLSKFDTTKLKSFGNAVKSEITLNASKIILGKNTQMRKVYNNMVTYLIPNGNWRKEGTNEVYNGRYLAEHYDGSTMSGTYLKISDETISYYSNGTSEDMILKILEGNKKVIANQFKKYGYEFVEWNTKADGTGVSYNPGDTIDSNSSVSLYAIWREKNNLPLLTEKNLILKNHFDEGDNNLYKISSFSVHYKIKLKYNNEEYTDDITIIKNSDNSEKIVKSINGFYYISTDGNGAPNYSTYFYNNNNEGITLKLPENVDYEIIPYNIKLNEYAAVAHSYSGKLTEDKTIDDIISPSKSDILLYFLTNDPYNKNHEVEILLDPFQLIPEATAPLYYTGTINGTATLKKEHFLKLPFNFKNGDMVTIHDFPTGTYFSISLNDSEDYYYGYNDDYSGYIQNFGYSLGLNYGTNSIYQFTKQAGSVGVENKAYKFRVKLIDGRTNKPVSKKIPYLISKANSNDKSGTIQFNEDGIGYFELYPDEKIYIGKKIINYDTTSYDRYLFDNENSILYNYIIDVKEDDDSNKYQSLTFNTSNYFTYSENLYNRRNLCNLKITKDLKITSEKFNSYVITYNDLKDNLINNQLNELKYNAVNYYNSKNNINISFKDITDEIINEYLQFLKENNKTKYLKYYSRANKFNIKLSLKDGANLENGNFNYNEYQEFSGNLSSSNQNVDYDEEENKYTFEFKILPRIVIDDEAQNEEYIMFNNLWCGMEYEIEELDNDKYDLIENNTKGILKHDGTSYYNKPVLNEASITNIEKKGTLTLNKKIKGNVSKDEEFKFDITLKLSDKDETKYNYTGSKEGTLEFVDGKASITLKGGESITISDLPYGIEYKVEENTKGYKVKKENDTGTIDKETVVTFTNSKEVKNITEIVNTLDGVGKYIAVALVSIIGIVTTIFLRKHSLER